VQLPDALIGAMREGMTLAVDASMPQRVQLLREDYSHFEQDPKALIERLVHLRPLVGGEEFDTWKVLAENRQVPELFERLMRHHYDPSYRRSILRNYPAIDASPRVMLDDLSVEGLLPVAQSMRSRFDASVTPTPA
jgi:tRNA 2-selenouridine synthase